MKRKFTAFLLAALLVLVLVPSGVFANVAETYDLSHYKITTSDHTGITDSEYSLAITKAGTYTIEMEAGCESSDAQLGVDIGDTEEITLIIKGITINAHQSINSCGIYIANAGTANVQIDGKNIVKSDGSGDCAYGIYADCSLNITGTGSLDISNTVENGICANGVLSINASKITLTDTGFADHSAVYAHNNIYIWKSTITVDKCSGSGIYAFGNIDIEKSTITIDNCDGNGIGADGYIDISGSTIDISKTGIHGISISGNIDISESTIDIDSTKTNGIYTNGDMSINASTITLTDIGIYYCTSVYTESGNIDIENSTITIDNSGCNGIYAEDGYIAISGSTIDINGTGNDGILADYGNIDIEKSTVTIDNCDWDGIGAYEGYIAISGSSIDVKNVACNGIWAYNNITIRGRSDIAINGAPLGAIVGRTIVLEDKLLVLEPTDAELIDSSWDGDDCQTYVHAGESLVFDDDGDPTNALGTIKIGKSMPSTIMQLMEWVREFAQKLAVLFNYFNTREVITF